MDKLGAMRTFRRVVELGAFAAAARDVGLSKAAVSRQIGDLEDFLGTALLTRTTRRLAPTEAGRAYYERCARILDEIQEAELAVGELQTAPRGTLRVNAPMSFGLLHLSPAIPEFMTRFPEVRVDLSMNDRAVDLVEEGFDVAVRGRSSLPDSSLVARRLAPLRRVLCAAPSYIERHGEPADLDDLPRHRCLIYSLSTSPREWTLRDAAGAERTVTVEGWYTANSSIALRDALQAGIGITLIPTFLVGEELRRGALVRVLKDLEASEQTLWALYPPNRYLSPKVRCFIDFLADRFGQTPPWDSARS